MNLSRRRLLIGVGSSALASAVPTLAFAVPGLPTRDPRQVKMMSERLLVADTMVAEAVAKDGVPGAVLLIGHKGVIVLRKAYGFAGLRPTTRPMKVDTVFDLASLTKPFATAASALILLEQGKIGLDDPVGKYLPAFAQAGEDKAKITIRHLFTHGGGLPSGGAYAGRKITTPEIVREIANRRLLSPPGEKFLYSDLSFISLGAVVEVVSGKSLKDFSQENIYTPLGMTNTGFQPDAALSARAAATTAGDDTTEARGIVHDPTARALGGVGGSAGLFSTADDLARFCQMILNHGEYAGVRILKPETVALATSKQSTYINDVRGLGWDIDTGYSIRGAMPLGSFGHTGFTGTSVWIDPLTDTFVLLLTNAVHGKPGPRSLNPLRRAVASAAAASIREFPVGPGQLPATLPASLEDHINVQTGLEVLIAEDFRRLEGKKIGVICNHTAVDRKGNHLVDLLFANKKLNLVALFGPEHSIRGDVDASVGGSTDPKTGVPIYSLYDLNVPVEQRYRPTLEMLKGIDTLVFDVQDIGVRYYTYPATMAFCMEAAKKAGIKILILDRPNPLGGLVSEGPLLEERFTGGFSHLHTMPISHGCTLGELAKLFNVERRIGADLEVVAMPNWNRRLWYDETGLPWVNPSPNIRNMREAALYPGVGFLERLPLSVGRGTDMPFEILGAPWIDGNALEANLSARRLPGVSFSAVRFTPTASKHQGVVCGGVQINLWDRRLCRPSALGIHLADALTRLRPDLMTAEALSAIQTSVGTTTITNAIAIGTSPADIIRSWDDDVEAWLKRREPFLLYS
jgi:uncharacterized protein YbbC (DUF1343 family)/CubicO group peptidase (beta-lactamase class C family)